ncbi:MAG: YggS family pyridoxal phosphate-dependent enzyme [Treponema sp.]|nr:YggS family pyridoxal phosphate-dependent enzyme [Treponema sp.]MBQ5645556.1 YggS family pyridoxal phosphate-dependent enzyme [Treponema sp.]MBQ5876366.1 YggS family pyridoxal phosphate-dependent enzyme [Treponema sp.]
MNSIENNLKEILQKIESAEQKYNRTKGTVKLLAVSKFHPVDAVEKAISAGHLLFGENRVQEAVAKFSDINSFNKDVELHIIGQLQTNKVKKAVTVASCIESVDRIDLLKEIQKQCEKINKKIKILFEVNTAEDSKSGFKNYEDLYEAVKYCADGNTPFVEPIGFMTMAPLTDDEALIRKSFSSLRKLSEKLQTEFPMFNFSELSMGMSNDYEIAIEEGSTEVRIGTAIFGEREY